MLHYHNVYESPDEADVPLDDPGSPCSKPACQGGYPTALYEPQGTPCGQGGVCTGTDGSCCTKSSCAGNGYNCGVIDDGCGGKTECGQCAPGDTCGPNQARVCGCTDGVQNGAETGVDCGGPCPSCSLLGLGKPCEAGAQCGSGHCADGVCCSSACAGSCEACVSPKTGAPTGTCAPVSSGADPDGECATQPVSSCGTTGACNGQGACALHPAGAECAPGSCSGGTEIAPDTCDGKGACLDGGSAPCPAPYVCGASGACQSCSDGIKNGGETATDCGGGCGPCPNGTPCSAAAECASGQCVDGVCCSSACTGACRSCNAGSPGACAFHPSGTDPENDCPGAKTCNGAGSCN